MKTYQEIFENALRKLNISKKDVKDYRPASEIHMPEIKGEIKGAVIIWTNDGIEILYREKGQKRFIEVDTTDTIGDLISRLVPKEEQSIAINDPMRDPIRYCIPGKIWRSQIPENVLYPEGSDYT